MRPVWLLALVAGCVFGYFRVAHRSFSPPVHVASEAEKKAIEAALVQLSARSGYVPGAERAIKAIKLDGAGWIVQITERASAAPGGLRVINTFLVGPNSSCQWLSIDEEGSY